MQKLNVHRFYELGAKLHGLLGCESSPPRAADMFAILSDTQALLDGFIKGDIFALDSSREDAVRLQKKIGAIFERHFIDAATKQLRAQTGEDRIDAHDIAMLRTLIEKFEHALAAELNRAPTYVAGKRGIYSTYDLAEKAEDVFGPSLRASIPTCTLEEASASGRALAFGLSTASVLHMVRGVEIMARQYLESFVGPLGNKGERTFPMYLKRLASLAEEEDKDKLARPDRRVVQLLTQIKEHYRNPIMAPDHIVSLDEATQLFGMASALIALMAEQITARRKADPSSINAKAARPLSSSALSPDEDDDMYDQKISKAS